MEKNFKRFFKELTGFTPFPFQEDFAVKPHLPCVLEAPTGSGKTATVVVGWLWKRFMKEEEVPRRLVYCLPMRVLVEQAYHSILQWVEKSGLDINVHILMGGEDTREWDSQPDKPSILVGTQDMLLSRALNRGYGLSRFRFPVQFALINDDCLWVMDEIQLMGNGLGCSLQLQGLREKLRTYHPTHTIWMSATLHPEWMDTPDYRIDIEQHLFRVQGGKEAVLQKRLEASKILHKLDVPENQLTSHIKENHQEGTLTLVIMNTVKKAVKLYQRLRKDLSKETHAPKILLLHSRYRPHERRQLLDSLNRPLSRDSAGLILIATQVVEAGMDISACTMYTEAAPWSSLVQRWGRLNRQGEFTSSTCWWLPVKAKNNPPYSESETSHALQHLEKIDDVSPTAINNYLNNLSGSQRKALYPRNYSFLVRKKDMMELFDTSTDLSGHDINVSLFIRDTDFHDVFVCWRTFDKKPPPDEGQPAKEELCPVPIDEFRRFVSSKKLHPFTWDHLMDDYISVSAYNINRPGAMYILPAEAGGYQPDTGWLSSSSKPVTPIETTVSSSFDAMGKDHLSSVSRRMTIAEHNSQVEKKVSELLEYFTLPEEEKKLLLEAARYHDWGKAHPKFQQKLQPPYYHERNDWAKAERVQPVRHGEAFRHELASSLALLEKKRPDLTVYLTAAHHGKIRLSIRSLPHENTSDGKRKISRGVREGDKLPAVEVYPGIQEDTISLSLQPMMIGESSEYGASWIQRMIELRNKYGPFRLAFLEALLRIADWQASRESRHTKEMK